eukprot:5041212-Pyramimonas_sp.AAC.1
MIRHRRVSEQTASIDGTLLQFRDLKEISPITSGRQKSRITETKEKSGKFANEKRDAADVSAQFHEEPRSSSRPEQSRSTYFVA